MAISTGASTTDASTTNEASTTNASSTDTTTTNEATTTDRSTTDMSTTDGSEGSSTTSMDGLALFDALAKSLLQRNTAWKLSMVSLIVVDEEHFRFDGGRGHFDDFLVEGIGAPVENVDKSLLLGGRNNNGIGSTDAVLGTDEDVVEMNFWVGNIPWGKGLDRLLGSFVQEQISGNLRGDARSTCRSNLATSTSVTEVERSSSSTSSTSM